MLDGDSLGYLLAQEMIDPSTDPKNRLAVEENWKKIANVIINYIVANATVTIPEVLLVSPSLNVNLTTSAGPAAGTIDIPSNNLGKIS